MESKALPLFEKIMGLFMRNGIRSMTMSDIASNLGISKKTLYKYVRDKDDLVAKLVTMNKQEEECFVAEINKSDLNAIDQSFEVTKFVTAKLNNVHPSIFYDLKKYYPDAWDIFQQHKNEYIATWLEENLHQGIKEGLYRDDLNATIIKDLYLARIDDMLEQKYSSLKEYSFGEVYLESFRYHIRGIASEKGIKYLINKIQKEKNKQHES